MRLLICMSDIGIHSLHIFIDSNLPRHLCHQVVLMQKEIDSFNNRDHVLLVAEKRALLSDLKRSTLRCPQHEVSPGVLLRIDQLQRELSTCPDKTDVLRKLSATSKLTTKLEMQLKRFV